MDMFEYVAAADPEGCMALCRRYGYDVHAEDSMDLADCLTELIDREGQPALQDLVDMHPDKTLIMEKYANPWGGRDMMDSGAGRGGHCSCPGCRHKRGNGGESMLQQLGQHGHSLTQTHQAGLFIIGGLLVLTLAMMATKS